MIHMACTGSRLLSPRAAECPRDSLYFNECDGSPHPLYPLHDLRDFERRFIARSGCPFRKLQMYRKAYGLDCRGQHYGAFTTLTEATRACSLDDSCGSVYDHRCDAGSEIHLCPKQAAYAYHAEAAIEYRLPAQELSARGSCLFLRPPWRGTFRCTAQPSISGAGLGAVRISLNAQQFVTNASVQFTYHGHPRVYGISPTSGSLVGGTVVNVSGFEFVGGAHYVCHFGIVRVGAVFVEADGVIACLSPAGKSGETVPLEVSLNAQQFSTQRVGFRYHAVPQVSSYSPCSGPNDGGTVVRIDGVGLAGGSDYRCRFDACGVCETAWSCGPCVANATHMPSAGGSLNSGGSLVCVSPPLSGWRDENATSVLLEVSLNSQQYTSTNASPARVYVLCHAVGGERKSEPWPDGGEHAADDHWRGAQWRRQPQAVPLRQNCDGGGLRPHGRLCGRDGLPLSGARHCRHSSSTDIAQRPAVWAICRVLPLLHPASRVVQFTPQRVRLMVARWFKFAGTAFRLALAGAFSYAAVSRTPSCQPFSLVTRASRASLPNSTCRRALSRSPSRTATFRTTASPLPLSVFQRSATLPRSRARVPATLAYSCTAPT